MSFIQRLDIAMMVAATIFLSIAIFALITPACISARIVKLFCALPSATRSVCSFAASSAWIFFLRPVFFLVLWCIAHTLAYLWDTAMEYLMYTPEERSFRYHCRINNEAERRLIHVQEQNLEHEQLLQQQQQQQQQPAFSESIISGWFPSARPQAQAPPPPPPPLFTGDGLPAAPPNTPIVPGRSKSAGVCPQEQKTHVADDATACWPPPHKTWEMLAAKARRLYPHASWRDDPAGMLDDMMAARYGTTKIHRRTLY